MDAENHSAKLKSQENRDAMATTTTSTTTSLELQEPSQSGLNTSQERIVGDDITEASRVVDAGVPEGGYGWWSLAACGTVYFLFLQA